MSVAKQVQARLRRVTQAQIADLYPHYPKPSQVKTFYAAVGRAIGAWQNVETWLYEVYRRTTAAQRPGAEACAFFAVPAFRTKLNLTTAAVKFAAHGNETLLTDWKSLSNRAARKADRRNEIAHGAVWTQFQEKRADRKIYIGPNLMDPRDALEERQQETEPLTLKRVRGYEKDFREIATQLRAFAQRIPPP